MGGELAPADCALSNGTMKDWNVVVTVSDQAGYRAARRKLRRLGEIERTGYHNVLVMRVPDVARFLSALEDMIAEDRRLLDDVSRIVPARATFGFKSATEFEERAGQIAAGWAATLAGSSFHVRMHRRGHRGELDSLTEERLLDGVILERTTALGRTARISFPDPDFVIDIETVDDRAGLSLWTREELARFPFLRID